MKIADRVFDFVDKKTKHYLAKSKDVAVVLRDRMLNPLTEEEFRKKGGRGKVTVIHNSALEPDFKKEIEKEFPKAQFSYQKTQSTIANVLEGRTMTLSKSDAHTIVKSLCDNGDYELASKVYHMSTAKAVPHGKRAQKMLQMLSKDYRKLAMNQDFKRGMKLVAKSLSNSGVEIPEVPRRIIVAAPIIGLLFSGVLKAMSLMGGEPEPEAVESSWKSAVGDEHWGKIKG